MTNPADSAASNASVRAPIQLEDFIRAKALRLGSICRYYGQPPKDSNDDNEEDKEDEENDEERGEDPAIREPDE
jgi:hypothetical protein